MLATKKRNIAVQIPAVAVSVGLMILLPFLIHLIPPVGGVPMGARLLPLFFIPFVAIVYFHPAVAFFAALVTPFLNQALTGSPPPAMAALLTLELVIFSGAAYLMFRRRPSFWGIAPLAYIAAIFLATFVAPFLPLLPDQPFIWSALGASLLTAWPGLLLLLLLNIAIVRNMNHDR